MDQQAREITENLVKNAATAILSTVDEKGFPVTRAMLNLPNNSLKQIWFTTNTSSGKIDQIKNNSKGSVYFCAPQEWRGILMKGTITIIEDLETKKKIWQPDWTMYYPEGIEDPDFAVLLLQTEKGYLYNQMQKSEFEI